MKKVLMYEDMARELKGEHSYIEGLKLLPNRVWCYQVDLDAPEVKLKERFKYRNGKKQKLSAWEEYVGRGRTVG